MKYLHNLRIVLLIIILPLFTVKTLSGQNINLNKKADFNLFIPIADSDVFNSNRIDSIPSLNKKTVVLNKSVAMGNLEIGNTISLNLFDEIFIVIIDKISTNVNNTTTVRARFQMYSMGYLLLSTTNGLSTGIIQIPELNQEYNFFTKDLSGIAVIEVSENRNQLNNLASDAYCYFDAMEPKTIHQHKSEHLIPNNKVTDIGDSIINIDLMVVYTPEAFKWFNEHSNGIENITANQIAYLNLCLENSLTYTQVSLVYSGLTDYVFNPNTVTNFTDALYRLQGKDDGYMDEIHELRDAYNADLVTLVAEIMGAGGVASALGRKTGASELSAFNVCGIDSWRYDKGVLAHEIGHNFGAGHNWEQTIDPGPNTWGDWPENTWSAGWKWKSDEPHPDILYFDKYPFFADEMSFGGHFYADSSIVVNLPYFSNPDVLHKGYPTGHPNLANNARTIREMREVLSKYRINTSGNYPLLTKKIINVRDMSATGGGEIFNLSNGVVTARGVCWSTSRNPTISDSTTIDGEGLGPFTSQLIGLIPNTTYYVRAYATNEVGTAYGNEVMFVTAKPELILTTASISNIGATSATSGGEVTNLGNGVVTARGVAWSTTPNPTINNSFTTDGEGLGAFTSQLINLNPNTTYYVRAYATNEAGTAYGNEIVFTTLEILYPDVSMITVSNIGSTSAIAEGEITFLGNGTVSAGGVLWSTSFPPTLNDSFTADSLGLGPFKSQLTGLNPNTTYYVRAYATNEAGTNYSSFIDMFTTKPEIVMPTVTTKEISNIAVINATSGGEVTNLGNGVVTARGVAWSTT
ncbi:M12 family metallo-peptidase, partial [Peijinzhouia sedimentorum]